MKNKIFRFISRPPPPPPRRRPRRRPLSTPAWGPLLGLFDVQVESTAAHEYESTAYERVAWGDLHSEEKLLEQLFSMACNGSLLCRVCHVYFNLWRRFTSIDVNRLPRPFPTHFTTSLHLWFFFEKKNGTFWNSFEVFPIVSLFLELRRLWDHSQIVDLIFLIRMVSTRGSETPKTSHSWQNNIPIPTLFSASFLIAGVW